jgi:hypothetical protein
LCQSSFASTHHTTRYPRLARHRYDAAETEFVAAKLDVHAKLVQKESLTEHLMVIIQKNEERKAQKLEELMKKMEISEQVRHTSPGVNGRRQASPVQRMLSHSTPAGSQRGGQAADRN